MSSRRTMSWQQIHTIPRHFYDFITQINKIFSIEIPMLDTIFTEIQSFFPLIITTAVVIAFTWLMYWLMLGRVPDMGSERKLPRQLVMIGLLLVGILAIAIAIPVEATTRNQIIGLIGLLLSGIIAFSSPTIVANLMSGLMLRVTRPFYVGDFIQVGDYFGRIVERGLLDTELQLESRELVSIPNTFLINNPVTVVRSSGTIVSVKLSLGYDAHHSKVEKALIKAAQDCGLEDPFVHILELGNFSVTYRINGLLLDIKNLLTMRTKLSRCVLDTLHAEGIEIVSPTFMNQRVYPESKEFIPIIDGREEKVAEPEAEKIVFDKAEQAEKIELEILKLKDEIEQLEQSLEKDDPGTDKDRLKEKIKKKQEDLQGLKDTKKEEKNSG